MKIGTRIIGKDHPPFVIAELSGNHKHDLSRAKQLIDVAAKAGVSTIKLQTYTADTITIDHDSAEFIIDNPDSLWNGRKLHELYDEAHTPWEWHEELFTYAHDKGLLAFSTPFDETAVDFLESLNVPCYKVASFEHHFIPLIEKIAGTGKPMIISCGMARLEEIEETVHVAQANGAKDIILLSCTSSYPANIEDCNLRTLTDMQARFPDVLIGLSDHTIGHVAANTAIGLGASVFEKHITLSRDDGAVDSEFSANPEELKAYVQTVNDAQKSLGTIHYGPASAAEEQSLIFRRSIYVVSDIKAGEALTHDNIRCIRPGYGLPPKYYKTLLGKKAATDIAYGTALREKMIEDFNV